MTTHSPYQIIQTLLVNNGLATSPESATNWPVFLAVLPDGVNIKDNAIGIFGITGTDDGRLMKTGLNIRHPGIQFLIRAIRHEDGYSKAYAIVDFLSKVHRDEVVLDGSVYYVQNFSLIGDILPLGQEIEKGSKKRHMFSINGNLTIDENKSLIT